ncbi:MAG: type III secretion system translocon subunit SctE [Candidatus Accumulibacter sp.]|jgi:hypothetical protein|nr:type III secretion system translocon subunit SctE [Accumulibacter sp.]
MVDLINPNAPNYTGTGGVDAADGTSPAGGKTGDSKKDDLPPVSDDDLALLMNALPRLAVPFLAGNISLEELVKAVGMETRQVATKTGLETLKANAAETEEANQKKLDEIQTRLEKLREKEKLSPFMKALKWIGLALSAIAAVATIAVAVATANPLLIAGAAIMTAMVINSIVSEATDGEVSISAGVAALAKECGASEETAQWIGMGVEIGITLIGAALSFGAGFTSSAAKALETTSKTIQIVAKAAQAASLASGLTTMAQGGLGIYDSVLSSDITKSKAAQKDLEAILARIAEAQDIETKFLESIMKRAEELLAAVQEIVQGNAEAQTAILGSQAPAVA